MNKITVALREVLKTEDEWRFIEPDLPNGIYSVWTEEYELPSAIKKAFQVDPYHIGGCI